MLKLKRVELLFPSPLLHFAVPDCEPLNEDLLRLGYRLREESPGIRRSNRQGWHSGGNLFREASSAVSVLESWIHIALGAAMDKLSARGDGPDPRFHVDGWMNINPLGGFNAPHTHPDCHWSGVYYVSQPRPRSRNAGMIEFLDPRRELNEYKGLRIKAYKGRRALLGQPGELYLFPSYLLHMVHPNDSEE